MLFFLRKIRRQLMEKNKVTTYLLYAIGEIVLVVAGILIAVQIDDWNKNEQDKKEEKVILNNLLEELQVNIGAIDYTIAMNKEAITYKLALLNLIGKSKEIIDISNPDSLLNFSFPGNSQDLSNSVYNDIVQSGRLKLITNKKLRLILMDIEKGRQLILERNDKLDNWTFSITLPFLSHHVSFKQMDKYVYPWGDKSNLEVDYYPVFQNLQFENILDNDAFLIQRCNEALELSKTSILEAIKEIKDNQ